MLLPRLALIGLAMVFVWSCSSMPVQELSDARLTIRSAREAGAAEYASESLSAAEILLQRATRLADELRFDEARQAAILARERASSARDIAILRAGAGSNGPARIP